MKIKKKGLRQNLKCFFREIRLAKDQKKGLHCNLGLYSAGIFRIYSYWLALDRFIIQRSNFDGWTSKSRWGEAKSRWGTLTLDWGTRPPYNLSTEYSHYLGVHDNRDVAGGSRKANRPPKNFHFSLNFIHFVCKFVVLPPRNYLLPPQMIRCKM